MYLWNTPSASKLGAYVPRRRPIRRRSLRGLAGAVPGAAANLTPSQMSTAGAGGATDPDQALLPIVPGASAGDVLYNAIYGNLSPAEYSSLVSQEQAAIVTAGGDPDTAAEQASADTTDVLQNFTAPGGAGLVWTGALPSQPGFPSAAGQAITNALENTLAPSLGAIPTWIWWAAGITGGLLVFGMVRRAV